MPDDRAQSFGAGQRVVWIDVLPREQKALELGDGDRRDVGAQAIERVAMNACQQAPVAPFEIWRT